MKRLYFIALFLLGLSTLLSAQSTIIEHLQEERPSEGVIKINASSEIKQLIGKRDSFLSLSDYIKISGHRVQIFSGSAARTARAEAFKRQELINEVFPEIPTYVTYTAPYWRLRVGDFRTQEEANQLRNKITKEIPSLNKEAYVVRDEVKIPAN